MRKKTLGSILKRKLHPFVSYAFLVGFGAAAVSGTSAYLAPELVEYAAPTPNVLAAAAMEERLRLPPDLLSLKTSAAEFSVQLAIIKSQIAELEKYGRVPPAALTDAIGQGEQLVGMIDQASTLTDLEGMDADTSLQSIGRKIKDSSQF